MFDAYEDAYYDTMVDDEFLAYNGTNIEMGE